MRALGDAAALAAHEEVREAAAVEEKDGLLAALRHAAQGLGQGRREDRAAAAAKLLGHVDHADLGQAGAAGTLGHAHASPGDAAPGAGAAAAERLERGRGRAEHERAAPLARHAGGDLASVVARGLVLLVGALVLLVDNDEARIGKRGEERRAGADDHAGLALAHEVPLVKALTGTEARVQDRDVVAEAAAEAAHGLRGEADLGHEDEGTAAVRERALDGVEVDLGLSGAGHAVDEHDVAAAGLAGGVDGGKRRALAVGEGLRARGGGRRERRGLGRAAHLAAALHEHDAAAGERGDGGGGPGDGGRELRHALRAGGEGLEHGALAGGVLCGDEVGRGGGEPGPALVDGACGLRDEAPGLAGGVAGHLDLLAGGEEGADGVGQRAGVLARHPARDLGAGRVEGGRGQDLGDGLDLRGVDAGRRVVGRRHDVADDLARPQGHEHRGADGDLGREHGGNRVVERAVESARGYVEHDARIRHGQPPPLGFGRLNGQPS